MSAWVDFDSPVTDSGIRAAVSQATIAGKLRPVLASELSAGFTESEINTLYDYTQLRRYLVGDGVADDTARLQQACSLGVPLFGDPRDVYLIDSLAFTVAGDTPPRIDWRGATIKARSVIAGALVTIENPHGPWPNWAFLGRPYIDCDNKAQTGLQIHGLQRCPEVAAWVENATGDGVEILHEAGFGCYYNRLDFLARNCGGHGVLVHSGDATYRCSANTTRIVSQFNLGDGANVDYFQGDIHLVCEKNNGYALTGGHTRDLGLWAGYSENNHQDEAQNPDDGTEDYTFNFDPVNSIGVKVLTGRHVGEVDTAPDNTGYVFHPTNKQAVFGDDVKVLRDLDVDGDLNTDGDGIVGGVLTRGGVAREAFSGTEVDVAATGGNVQVRTRAELGANAMWRGHICAQGGGQAQEVMVHTQGAGGSVTIVEKASVGTPNVVFADDGSGNLVVQNDHASNVQTLIWSLEKLL